MSYKKYQFNTIQHLAGIVPIGGKNLDFEMPWHDSLMPIAPNYLAVERAVYECALAGCETIWVVGHKGTTPLLRKRLQDFILDPVLTSPKMLYRNIRKIPIYYVPILPKDHDKRDCLAWSVLYGADCAFRVSSFISKWVAAKRFYCAFPYGIMPEQVIRENRELLKKDKNVIFSYSGTVKNNLHLSFTFESKDYKNARDIVRKRIVTDWHDKKETELNLAEVFSMLDTENCSVVELPWFYDISSWQKYTHFLNSEHASQIKKHEACFINEKRKIFASTEDLLNKGKEYEQEDGESLQQPITDVEGKDGSS